VSTDRAHPAYAVLAADAGEALRTAGPHGDEVGAYGLVQATPREQNTAIALAEYLRVGIDAGFVRVT
jgi:hypothetical protein